MAEYVTVTFEALGAVKHLAEAIRGIHAAVTIADDRFDRLLAQIDQLQETIDLVSTLLSRNTHSLPEFLIASFSKTTRKCVTSLEKIGEQVKKIEIEPDTDKSTWTDKLPDKLKFGKKDKKNKTDKTEKTDKSSQIERFRIRIKLASVTMHETFTSAEDGAYHLKEWLTNWWNEPVMDHAEKVLGEHKGALDLVLDSITSSLSTDTREIVTASHTLLLEHRETLAAQTAILKGIEDRQKQAARSPYLEGALHSYYEDLTAELVEAGSQLPRVIKDNDMATLDALEQSMKDCERKHEVVKKLQVAYEDMDLVELTVRKLEAKLAAEITTRT